MKKKKDHRRCQHTGKSATMLFLTTILRKPSLDRLTCRIWADSHNEYAEVNLPCLWASLSCTLLARSWTHLYVGLRVFKQLGHSMLTTPKPRIQHCRDECGAASIHRNCHLMSKFQPTESPKRLLAPSDSILTFSDTPVDYIFPQLIQNPMMYMLILSRQLRD